MTVVSVVILLTVNLVSWDGAFWSLIPIGSILYFWLIVRYGVLSKQNIAFKLALLTTVLVVLMDLIEQYYGNPGVEDWSLNYVTPFAFLACNLAISVIIWIRRINYRDYIFYLISIIIFSLVPIILALVNVITIKWPAITAFGVAVFILLFIIFFFPKSIKEEIKKRFHL